MPPARSAIERWLGLGTARVEFVDKLTKINRGRAYYASPYNLAEFLFTDYIRNRKKFLH